MVLLFTSQVPLANDPGCIPCKFQGIPKGFFRRIHAQVGRWNIGFMTKALLVATSNQACPGRAADRCSDMCIGENYATFCQPVQVGRGNIASHKTKIGIPCIISKDDDDVWRGIGPVTTTMHHTYQEKSSKEDMDRSFVCNQFI